MPNKGLSKEVMLQKRAEGKDNGQIAEECQCSRARVYQLIGGVKQYKPRGERAKEEMAGQA